MCMCVYVYIERERARECWSRKEICSKELAHVIMEAKKS